jgi:hypothetical protein
MSKSNLTFLLFLLIPSIAEIIDASQFTITIPNSPFSLGRITFLFVGINGILSNKNRYINSNTRKGLLLIFLGGIIGAFFSDKIGLSLSRSIGTIILFFASTGIASLLNQNKFQKFIDLFFILNLSYVTYYVLKLTFSKGLNFISYSSLFLDEEAINHHIIGVNASVSCIYLALRFFYKKNQLSFLGFLIIFVGLVTCFLSESRSNMLITLIVLFLILIFSKIKFFNIILVSIPSIFLIYIIFSKIAYQNDSLFQRFDITDTDYQQRTTAMRFEFLGSFLIEFFKFPFGKGVFGTEIQSSGFESTMIHNQYLTYVLSGGIIALIGVYLWITEFVTIFKYSIRRLKAISIFNHAITFSMFTFLLTLTTVEYSGLLFFIYVSFLMYLSENYLIEKK